MTRPWKSSTKHTRKISSPTRVTLGFVAAGVTSGTPAAWATEAASSVRADEHSPTSATTRSREISFFTAVADSPASERSSSTTSSTGRPSTPPAAFRPSTASRAPRSEASPNEASRPVIDMKNPIRTGSPAKRAGAAHSAAARTRRAAAGPFICGTLHPVRAPPEAESRAAL